MEKHVNIKDLNEGSAISGTYIINNVGINVASSGNRYLCGSLSDATGSVCLRAWDYKGQLTSADNGSIVNVRGNVVSYKDAPQVTAESIELFPGEKLCEEVISQLVPVAPINFEAARNALYQYIESISDCSLYGICKYLINKHAGKFFFIPAAKSIHHGFRYGLLMHTLNMCGLSASIAKRYGSISYDLLMAGTILHDIGKTKEFSVSPVTGLVTDYSLIGNSLGHACIGVMEIEEAAKMVNADCNVVLQLEHLILSHHGSMEYGAAKVPITLEAEILHCVDMIDSRCEIYHENLSDVGYGDLSKYIPALEKRILRNPIECVLTDRHYISAGGLSNG